MDEAQGPVGPPGCPGPIPPALAAAMLKDRRLRESVHAVIESIEDAKRPDYEDVALVLRFFGVKVVPG